MNPQTKYHPNVQVRESDKEGRGLFATGSISKGEILTVTAGREIVTSDIPALRYPLHAFQIQQEILLAPHDEGQLSGIFLTNHSCSPNAGVQNQSTLVALRDISAGEEICYDYAMTDSEPAGGSAFKMSCKCGASNCRSLISDSDWREGKLQKKYLGFFSNYLAERIASPQS